MSIHVVNKNTSRLINGIFAAVVLLGGLVSVMVYIKGDKIAVETTTLIAQDVPAYELLRKLNSSLIEQERFIYEFYATEQEADFSRGYKLTNQQAHQALDELFIRFGDVVPLKITQDSLLELNSLANKFVLNIASPQTDWNLARQQLRIISNVRRATHPQIQALNQITEQKVASSEVIILQGLESMRLFVVLYGLGTLIIAFVVAKTIQAYLSSSVDNRRLSLFPERNPNPVISLDHDNTVTYGNPATDRLLQRLNMPLGHVEMLLAENLTVYQQEILVDGKMNSKQFSYQVGELFFQCDLHWLADQRQWDLHLIDITERKAAEHELEFRASHNPLTGLPNHYELEKSVTHMSKEDQIFALGVIEIRSYSQLVSGQGVTVASTVVKELAELMQSIFLQLSNENCTIYHIGEKSFALLSTSHLHKDDIDSLIKLVEKEIGKTVFHCQYQVQLDFGFCCYPQHGNSYAQLYKNALSALDKSASSKDKHYVLFTHDLGEKLQYQQQLLEDMLIAFEKEQFELYFQPQLELESGKVIGAETLIRWQRKGQWVSPAEFIPLAESGGLIGPIGDWILHKACEKAKSLVSLGFEDLVIAVNISPLQFARKDFLSKVTAILDATQLPAKNLELEITEGVIIYNESDTIETLEKLKGLGVQLAIDDFGTGYSSLSYLKKFNIDKLKIDQSFVRQIEHDTADQSIVRTIIELGRNLNLKVIAEGVELQEQQDILFSMGCDEIQGYYFCKPLSEDLLVAFLQKAMV